MTSENFSGAAGSRAIDHADQGRVGFGVVVEQFTPSGLGTGQGVAQLRAGQVEGGVASLFVRDRYRGGNRWQLNQRAVGSTEVGGVVAEFRSVENRIAGSEVHSAGGAELRSGVGEESTFADAATGHGVAEVGRQDAVGRTFVQSGRQ
ncbi:hypothetical protein D3C78_1177810 [compost metagenome]